MMIEEVIVLTAVVVLVCSIIKTKIKIYNILRRIRFIKYELLLINARGDILKCGTCGHKFVYVSGDPACPECGNMTWNDKNQPMRLES